jgi:hypothetical protein
MGYDCVIAWWCVVSPSSGTAVPIRNSLGQLRISVVVRHNKKTRNRDEVCCCGGASESKGGDGDVAATVANAVRGGDSNEEENVDAAAALPHAVTPVGAPSLHSCADAEKRKGYSGDAAATF